MSHPNPSHDPENEYPSDHYKPSGKIKKMAKKVNYTGTHAHSHNKGGLVGEMKGLMNTKHFGAKHGARHKDAQKGRGKEHPF